MDCRYALDVHTDRAEDVLTHKQLLEEAKVPENRPVFHVRAVQVSCSNSCTAVVTCISLIATFVTVKFIVLAVSVG